MYLGVNQGRGEYGNEEDCECGTSERAKARAVLEGARSKVQEAGQRLNAKATKAKDQALIGTLDKGISLLQTAKNKLK